MNMRRAIVLITSVLATLVVAACESLITKPSLYGTIRAEVKRRDGTPIAGAQVQLYTGQRPIGFATTDANGAYTFVDVADGVYGLRTFPPAGYFNIQSVIGGKDSSFRDQLQLNPGDNLRVSFSFLKEGRGTITARVIDSDGKPMPDVRVVLFSSGGSIADSKTDQSGSFQFATVPQGNYGVFAARPIAYQDSGEAPLPSRDGIVVDDGSTHLASFQFALCNGSLDVRVRDNTGAPVPGTLLTFYGAFGVQDSILGADASRSIPKLGCGSYGVRIRPPVGWTADEGRGTTFQDNLSIHRGTALNVALTVKRIGRGTVRIQIMDQFGGPVANTRVVLYTGQGLVRDVVTGADGFVSMTDLLVNSEYGVRVVPAGSYTSPEGPGTTFIDGIKLVDGQTRDYVFRFQAN